MSEGYVQGKSPNSRSVRCCVDGCDGHSGLFGACDQHRHIPIDAEFTAAVARGAAPADRPACFETDQTWREYVACWALKEKITSRYSKHVEFCRDCSPQYKVRMESCGRCSHRETVFVRKHTGEVVGVSSHFVSRWESAVLGLYGELLLFPSQQAVDETNERIAKARAPKRMGRPRKNRDE